MSRRYIGTKFIFAVIIGLFATIHYYKKDPSFIMYVENKLQHAVQEMNNCHFSASIKDIQLWPLGLKLENVMMNSLEGKESWHWNAETVTCSLSLFHYFYTGSIGCTLTVDNYFAFSRAKYGYPDLFKYYQELFQNNQEMPLNIALQSLHFSQSQLTVFDTTSGITTTFFANGQGGLAGTHFKTRIFITDGQVKQDETVLADSVTGTTTATVYETFKSVGFTVDNQLECTIKHLAQDEQNCTITSHTKDFLTTYTCSNSTDSLHLEGTVLPKDFTWKLHGNIPLSYPLQFIHDFSWHPKGTIGITIYGDKNGTHQANARIAITDPFLCHICKQIDIHSFTHDEHLSGTTSFVTHKGKLSGSFIANMTEKTIHCTGTNHNQLHFKQSHWHYKPYDLSYDIFYKQSGTIKGIYSSRATHKATDESIELKGRFLHTDKHSFFSKGVCDSLQYQLKIPYNNSNGYLHIASKDGTPLFHYNSTQEAVNGFCHFPFIHHIAKRFTTHDMRGQGTITFEGTRNDTALHLALKTNEMALPLLHSCNFISHGSVELSFDQKTNHLAMRNGILKLHKGTIVVPELIAHFNSLFQPTFIHAPYFVSDCFFNIQDSVFATFSGTGIVEKNYNQDLTFKNFIIIEKGHIKENPLAQQWYTDLTHSMQSPFIKNPYTSRLQTTVITRTPFSITTPQLKTELSLFLQAENSLTDPWLSGIIKLHNGYVQFSYNKLPFIKGTIQFRKKEEPLLDILLRGMVKRHTISLAATGQLSDPHIMLDASPHLTQEQIISLLLAGTTQESLNMVIPSLVVNNIESILFGTSQSLFKKTTFADALKRIRIIPIFTDQTGRGGVRGALEIDVTDTLRTIIQKNFTLSEDSRIDIEYDLNDDVTLHFSKDERSDLGAEVEMRFKF